MPISSSNFTWIVLFVLKRLVLPQNHFFGYWKCCNRLAASFVSSLADCIWEHRSHSFWNHCLWVTTKLSHVDLCLFKWIRLRIASSLELIYFFSLASFYACSYFLLSWPLHLHLEQSTTLSTRIDSRGGILIKCKALSLFNTSRKYSFK